MSDIYNEMHLTDAGKVFFLLCRFKSVLKKQAAHGILPRRNAQNKEKWTSIQAPSFKRKHQV